MKAAETTMIHPAPYGANDKLAKWATERGWRYSPHAHCLHWISRGRCGVGICLDGHLSRRWMDHISGWTKGDERMLLCQPYELYDFVSLIDACEKFNLAATVHGNGWYGYGTIAIELRPKGNSLEGNSEAH
jgi:hypothetical protein